MIIHESALISEDIFEKNFICNLSKCKGACCVEGDFGAPISKEEIEILENEIENIKPFLSKKSLDSIEEKGIWEKDKDDDLVTTCLPSGECNFSVMDENKVLHCGIELAFKSNKTSFQKPISCHLYPIRITKVGEYEALNYHRWDICKDACTLGNEHKIPVFKFLKSALSRKFGIKWYNELEKIAEALNKN